MSEDRQESSINCDCQDRINQGTEELYFRCTTCTSVHLLDCRESIFETREELIYIETECRSCILGLFISRSNEEVDSVEDDQRPNTPSTSAVIDELQFPEDFEIIQIDDQEITSEEPPSIVQLERCEICNREIWYLTREEWNALRHTLPTERALCSDCEEEPTEDEKENLIREMNKL